MILNSFKTIFMEIRYMLAILLVVTVSLVGTMLYVGSSFTDTEEDEEEGSGLVFTKLTETLYSMTGEVGVGDCEKIMPLLPTRGTFVVILESPGGSLHDGACLAAHLKIRSVVTVVRTTAVLDEDGNTLYQPDADGDGRVVCASACSLMFLGGDMRYLIGDVWFGIHGPRTANPDAMSPAALEASAYRTAASVLDLLKDLGVIDEALRLLFIRIPASTMYWLNPIDFGSMPTLITLATNYINFRGLTAENPMGSVGG
jgi:hypothetical protein